MREADFMRRCMKRATDLGARLFRNNVAVAWTGKVERFNRTQPVQIHAGDIVIREARPLHAGLAPGSADLIGWVPVVVTPDMVGETIAVFASVETKTARGRPTKEQTAWARVIDGAGGYSGIARTDADLDNILRLGVYAAQGVDKTST